VGLSVPQAIHRVMSEALCCDLRDALESGSLDGSEIGSIRCRACVVLCLLLCDHPVDRRGRCRSCRRTGAVLGKRRRKCRIHVEASFWLRQPDDVVLRHLAHELNSTVPTPPRHSSGRVGWPDPDHGGIGAHSSASGPAVFHSTVYPPRTGQAEHVVLSGRTTEVTPGAD
jgi:hypothetical protein